MEQTVDKPLSELISAETVYVKYVYLDVVKFTDRSVEAQSFIVAKLNEIVRNSVKSCKIDKDKCIFIPTGDGICIALMENKPYDIHILVALEILKSITVHNADTAVDNNRKFMVRIGINENTDNYIVDINGRWNVAGTGVNMAQRIMSNADGGQILVGQSVYEILKQREKYILSFRSYAASGKHGISFNVYQFIPKGILCLNTDVPKAFVEEKTEWGLTKHVAYYFAHAIKNKKLLCNILKKGSYKSYGAVVMLWLLAKDSYELSEAKEYDSVSVKQLGGAKAEIQDQLAILDTVPFWIRAELCEFIANCWFKKYYDACFEAGATSDSYLIINTRGQEKLKKEYPEIWVEFKLDESS